MQKGHQDFTKTESGGKQQLGKTNKLIGFPDFQFSMQHNKYHQSLYIISYVQWSTEQLD